AVVAGAFGAGYVAQLHQQSAGAGGGPARAVALLDRVETSLGYAGFLKAYRQNFLGSDPAAAQSAADLVARAKQDVEELLKLAPAAGLDASTLAELRALLGQYSIATAAPDTLSQASARPTPESLETTYAAIKQEGLRLRQKVQGARLNVLSDITAWTHWIIAGVVSALVLSYLLLMGFFSSKVMQPLRQLSLSASAAAAGQTNRPIWGVGRQDEFGVIAQSLQRLQAEAAPPLVLTAGAAVEPFTAGLPEALSQDLNKAVAAFESRAQNLTEASGATMRAAQEQAAKLSDAVNLLADLKTEIASFKQDTGDEVRSAVEAIRTAGPAMPMSSAVTDAQIAQFAAGLTLQGERLTATTAQLSEPATTALAEFTAAMEGLRMAAQDARANQTSVSSFSTQAVSQTTEAIGLVQNAGLQLNAALSLMEERIGKGLTSVDQLTESLSASAVQLSSTIEESARRLGSAAKDIESRSQQAELRFGLALDEAGQQARANAKESAALRQTLSQALEDLRIARASLETAHGAPGVDLSQVLTAVHGLQTLLVQKAGDQAGETPQSLEINSMSGTVRNLRAIQTGSLPIAASEMLARLGSIAQEVRLAAGHELGAIKQIAQDILEALAHAHDAGDTDHAVPSLVELADRLDNECAQLSPVLADVQRIATDLARGLRAPEAATEDGLATLAASARSLMAELDTVEAMEAPKDVVPRPRIVDTIESTAVEIQRLSDLIADLEARAESLAGLAMSEQPEALDGLAGDGRLTSDLRSADAHADAAIQTVFQAIERLGNIAQALARAGDMQKQRLAGE
ncbi:MAG TPA: hypothetical protein DCL54_10530, partial [Alphaproteobacteria bacterium]|nr:hypothetical protein [Alphaproteobacteria bacterium]